jgi:hypothetical protein
LADDHDVHNNMAGQFRGSVGLDVASNGKIPTLPIGHVTAGVNALPDAIKAAKAAFLEYQFQAWQRIPAAEAENSCEGTVFSGVECFGRDVWLNVSQLGGGGMPARAIGEEFTLATDRALYAAVNQSVQSTFDLEVDDLLLDPPVEVAGVPLEASTSVRVGSVAVLLIDTRLHRAFAYNPERPVHSIMSVASLARIWTLLKDLERDDSVKEIVVASSIPILWMDETLAHLAYIWENDRYTTEPIEMPGVAALLEILASSNKIHTFVGGDVHVLAHARACREPPFSAFARARGSVGPLAAREWKRFFSHHEHRQAYTSGMQMLIKALHKVGEPAAASMVQAILSYAAFKGIVTGDTLSQLYAFRFDPATVLRHSLVGREVASLEHQWSPTRCYAQLVASGVTRGSSGLSDPAISLYNAALRWLSAFKLAFWSGVIDDISLANNYIRMVLPSPTAPSSWWHSHLKVGSDASNRWPSDVVNQHVRVDCSKSAPGIAGVSAMSLSDFVKEGLRDVRLNASDEAWRSLVRAGAQSARQADVATLAHATGVEGLVCECGAKPGSSLVYTACRRVIETPGGTFLHDIMDSGTILLLVVLAILLLALYGLGIVAPALCCGAWGGCYLCCWGLQSVAYYSCCCCLCCDDDDDGAPRSSRRRKPKYD